MSFTNPNQDAGAEASSGTAARDFGTTQEATITSKKEQNLVDQGKMPGLAEVQKDTHVRPPGEEDAAGNKIHHKGVLGRMLHWQHDSMNADK